MFVGLQYMQKCIISASDFLFWLYSNLKDVEKYTLKYEFRYNKKSSPSFYVRDLNKKENWKIMGKTKQNITEVIVSMPNYSVYE